MRVTVRMFARLRELAGRDRWDLDVPPGASVDDVWQQVSREYTDLAPFGQAISCAVNATFASRRAKVAEGDEIAFLPPVSGG
jgi:molybdopterin converting factor subunit 1